MVCVAVSQKHRSHLSSRRSGAKKRRKPSSSDDDDAAAAVPDSNSSDKCKKVSGWVRVYLQESHVNRTRTAVVMYSSTGDTIDDDDVESQLVDSAVLAQERAGEQVFALGCSSST